MSLPNLLAPGVALLALAVISQAVPQTARAQAVPLHLVAAETPEPEDLDRAPGLKLEDPASGTALPETPIDPEDEEGSAKPADDVGTQPGENGDDTPEETAGPQNDDVPLPQVRYGEEGLPKPVARLRAQILDAARTGDVEKLRPVIEANEVPPTFSFSGTSDPIAHLREASGDEHGREALAIMIEVLEAGWVLADAGTPQEMYIWPYFARYPFDKLTPEQMVELFKIITAGDYQDMETYGSYIFYRLGIGPDGTWHFFVAGD